jgi:hypothetical protein
MSISTYYELLWDGGILGWNERIKSVRVDYSDSDSEVRARFMAWNRQVDFFSINATTLFIEKSRWI